MASFTFSEPWNKGTAVSKYPYPIWGAQTSKYVKVEQCAGPVFPVERKNDYALETPKGEKAQDQKHMTSPVYQIEITAHNYKVDAIADIDLPKYLMGPKYSPDDGKSGYVPKTPVSDITPLINAPVFNGVEASNHFTPTLPAKIAPEPLMCVPLFPVDHGSKYTTQQFGCSGKGLSVDSPQMLAAPGNRATGDRNAALIESKNTYLPEVSKKEAPPIMHGPKFPNVESFHSYGPVPARVPAAEARMEMPGPVFPGVESNNQYSKIEERVHGEPLFIGPKLPGVESSNVYAPVEERRPGQLVMIGPVFDVEHKINYTPEINKVEGTIVMQGPKFRGVDDSSKYNMQMRSPQIESDRLMTTPCFPGIEAANKYAPVEPPLAPNEKITRTEPMVAPKYPNIVAKNQYVPEEPANTGSQHIMTAPKYAGVEESHKYGPVTERKEAVRGICVPVYTEDPTNQYSNIPDKKCGELIQASPVYRGVDPKSCYNPVEEKVTAVPILVGPMYAGVEHDSKYTPETKRVDPQIVFAGPVFRDIDHSSKNNPKMERAPIEGQRLMTTPIYPGIEASNSYGTSVY